MKLSSEILCVGKSSLQESQLIKATIITTVICSLICDLLCDFLDIKFPLNIYFKLFHTSCCFWGLQMSEVACFN